MYNKKDKKIYDKTKRYLENRKEKNIEEKLNIVNSILEISDKKERYSYLYDLVCDYLDKEFKEKNICGFKNNICKNCRFLKEKEIKKDSYLNGCCHRFLGKTDCRNLDLKTGKCKIKNISCKLFTCKYLKKEGYKFNLNDIYLSRYFFNFRQKYYLKTAFFLSKEEVLKEILKR